MFGKHLSPSEAYASVGLETSVQNADPHTLILLLFEGARKAILMAKHQIEVGDVAGKGKNISHAVEIISGGLKAGLNLDAGEELAERLDALYDYMIERLIWANIHDDAATLDEILALLWEIHSAWVGIAPGSSLEAA